MRPKDLVGHLRARIGGVEDRLAAIEDRPRVVCLGWLNPVLAGGHWIPELVALAGGRDCLAQPGDHIRRLDWDEIRVNAPEVLVLMPCSFDLARTLREAHVVSGMCG